MAAEEGNKYAEIWTEETAIEFSEKILDEVKKNEKCRSLSTACKNVGGYDTLFNYFEEKFNKVFEPIKEAKSIIKSRLIEQGLDQDANATMAIFILKNNHDMSDRVQNTNVNANIETDRPLSEEEIKAVKDKLDKL